MASALHSRFLLSINFLLNNIHQIDLFLFSRLGRRRISNRTMMVFFNDFSEVQVSCLHLQIAPPGPCTVCSTITLMHMSRVSRDSSRDTPRPSVIVERAFHLFLMNLLIQPGSTTPTRRLLYPMALIISLATFYFSMSFSYNNLHASKGQSSTSESHAYVCPTNRFKDRPG